MVEYFAIFISNKAYLQKIYLLHLLQINKKEADRNVCERNERTLQKKKRAGGRTSRVWCEETEETPSSERHSY